MDFFAFKKLVATLVAPLPIALALMTLALIVCWWRGESRVVRWSLLFAWLLIVPLSMSPIVARWVLQFEQLYPAYSQESEAPVQQIIVLACYAVEDPKLPLSSQIHSCSRGRLIEAMRIWRAHPEAQILLSGGAMRFGDPSMAQIGANLLQELGVPEAHLKVIHKGRDTNSEVIALKPHLTELRPVLVTSATHMKRAVRLFARHGISVIPAPAEHLVLEPSSTELSWQSWVPKPYNLYRADRAWYATLANILVTIQSVFQEPPPVAERSVDVIDDVINSEPLPELPPERDEGEVVSEGEKGEDESVIKEPVFELERAPEAAVEMEPSEPLPPSEPEQSDELEHDKDS